MRKLEKKENKGDFSKVLNKTKEDKIIKILKDIEAFKNFLNVKNTKWIGDIDNLIHTGNNDLAERFIRLGNDTSQLLPGEDSRLQKQIYLLYKRMFNSIKEKTSVNYNITKAFFLKKYRRKLDYVKHYIDIRRVLVDFDHIPKHHNSEIFQSRFKKYKEIKHDFEKLLEDIEYANEIFYDSLLKLISKDIILYDIPREGGEQTGGGHQVGGLRSGIMLLEEDDQKGIVSKYENIQLYISTCKNKLKSFYTLNYSVMDIIIDAQFTVLYLIKGLRILFTYIALFLSTRVFSPIYEEKVYDQKANPPGLWQYMFIFLGFDIAFNCFLVVVLFLLQFLFKTEDNSFIVDKYMFFKYLIDYAVSMIIMFLIGILVSKVITDKKYFKYKYEGLRAIRAFESIMFFNAIPIYMFPYFMAF